MLRGLEPLPAQTLSLSYPHLPALAKLEPVKPVFMDVFPDVDEFRPSPNSNAWKSTHITMPDPIWTAEEIMAYVDGLGSPDVYWATFGFYPTTYEPMLRAAYNELVAARAAAAQP